MPISEPGKNEPRGCPTPGACSADLLLAQMREAIGAAMIAIGLAKAIPEVAAEYDFEPVYKQLTDTWRASEPQPVFDQPTPPVTGKE